MSIGVSTTTSAFDTLTFSTDGNVVASVTPTGFQAISLSGAGSTILSGYPGSTTNLQTGYGIAATPNSIGNVCRGILLSNTSGGSGAGTSIDWSNYGSSTPSARILAFDDGNGSSNLSFYTRLTLQGNDTLAPVECMRVGSSSHVSICRFLAVNSSGLGNPNFPLDLGSTSAVNSIALYNNSGNVYSLGAGGGILSFNVPANNSHNFYIGSTPSSLGALTLSISNSSLNFTNYLEIDHYSSGGGSGLKLFTPNLASGNSVFIKIGKSTSSNYDRGLIGFTYVSSGSYSNMLHLGLEGRQPISILLNSATGYNFVGVSSFGATTPLFPLDVSGNLNGMNEVAQFFFAGTGNVSSGGTYSYAWQAGFTDRIIAQEYFGTSDVRYKSDIRPIKDSIDTALFVDKVDPVSFRWKSENTSLPTFGYISQNVIKYGFSSLIRIVIDEKLEEYTDDYGITSPKGCRLHLNYEKVVCILHQEIKNVQQEIRDLEKILSNK